MNATPITSRPSSHGFTLVEVMMAILIMTVGLFGLLQSVIVAYEHNSRNRLREEAVLIAEEQMSNFRINTASFHAATTVTGPNARFEVSKELLPIGGNANRLKVAVQWSFKNKTTAHEIYLIKKM